MTKEFKLGYYIEADALQTEEGIKEYTEMAKWCNLHKYVIKQEAMDMNYEAQNFEDRVIVDVYVIAEPDKPKEPTKVEQLEQEMAKHKQYLADTDYMAIKCGELGLSMVVEYPVEYQRRIDARKKINALETELAGLQQKDKDKGGRKK